jgi:hypothetical protein
MLMFWLGMLVQIYQARWNGRRRGKGPKWQGAHKKGQEGCETAGSADQRTRSSWICWCPIVASC